MLAKYEGELEGQEEKALNREAQFQKRLIVLAKYASRLKANAKGETTQTNINLINNAPIHKILNDVKNDFKGRDFEVYIQPVQHHDVQVLWWALFLHKDLEIEFQKTFFK